MAVSKFPCLTLSRVNVMLDAKISLVPTHQLIVPSTLLAPATEIRTRKDTKIHTLKPLTYELFFQIAQKLKGQDVICYIHTYVTLKS